MSDQQITDNAIDAMVRDRMQALLDRYGQARVQSVFEGFMATMRRGMEQAEFEEASGMVVIIFDPETNRRSVHGPFPKDMETATAWAAEHEDRWNESNQGDGPDLIYSVELLFEPT